MVSSNTNQAALALFDELADLSLPEQQQRLAALDPALRETVAAMLATDREQFGLLDGGVDSYAAALIPETDAAPAPPERVGAYRIIDTLGRGGMAVVYRAEREEADFQQTVALKLIHAERIGQHWQQRFVQERQILASLRHPNIAQLLDGGISDDGRPFLALEFVDGEPLNRFCDSRQLSINQRLDLVLAVCDAVSYAHQRLIVHRDLKPANILVDKNGTAKLLDFGIAKLIDQPNDVQVTRTEYRALTPEYAAPEQFTGEPVTTATDIYALGIVLYQLLSGQRPFTTDTGGALALERQVLTEGTPTFERAAGRVDATQKVAMAQARGLSWPQLRRALRGDLQNVVRKATSREPERRYQSVVELAEDIKSYLRGLPVKARAGRWYRIRRLAWRYRWALGTSMAVMLAVISGSIYVTRQAQEIARQAARAEAVQRFLIEEMLQSATPERARGRDVTVAEVLEQAAARIDSVFPEQPLTKAQLRQTVGEALLQVGQLELAEPQLQQAYGELVSNAGQSHPDTLLSERSLALLQLRKSRHEAAEQQLQLVFEQQRSLLGATALPTLVTRGWLARSWHRQGRWVEAKQALKSIASALDTNHPEAWRDKAWVLSELARVEADQRNYADASGLVRRTLAMQEQHLGADHPERMALLDTLGDLLRRTGQLDDAEDVFGQAVDLSTKLYGADHPETLYAQRRIVEVYWFREAYAQMATLQRDLLERQRAVLGERHDATVRGMTGLALALGHLDQDDEAIVLMRQAADYYSDTRGEASPAALRQLKNLQSTLLRTQRIDEALINGQKLVAIARRAVTSKPTLGPTQLADLAYLLLTIYPVELRDVTTSVDWAEQAVANGGADNPDILDTLARGYRAQGKIKLAIETQRRAAELPGGIYGYSTDRELMAMYTELGDFEGAERFFRDHLARRREQLPADHHLIGWSHLWVGRSLLAMGQLSAAEEKAREALNHLYLHQGESNGFTLRARSHLAAMLTAQGRYDEAEPHAIASYVGLLAYDRQRNVVKRRALQRIVDLYTAWNQPQAAEPWARQLAETASLSEHEQWPRSTPPGVTEPAH